MRIYISCTSVLCVLLDVCKTVLFFTFAVLSVHNGSTNEILVALGGDVPLNCNSPGAELLFNGETRSIPNNRLTNVTSDDSGFYQCREGGTSAGNKITSTYVNVVNMHLSANYTSAQACTLDLTCTLEHPVPEKSLKWFKNGIEISDRGRWSVNHNKSNGVSTTTLNVRDLNSDDGGEYKCEADIYTQYQTASPVSLTVDVVGSWALFYNSFIVRSKLKYFCASFTVHTFTIMGTLYSLYACIMSSYCTIHR